MRTKLSALGFGLWLRRILGIRLGCLYQYPPQVLSVPDLLENSDDNGLPSIVLVTPSFNQSSFVGATVNSVLAQDYPRLQYVVQDACSVDGSVDILMSFIGRGPDIRIEADRGQADALNRGFAGASADVMAYLNSDDLLLPGTLHFVGRYFRDNPSVDVIYGNRLIVDANGLEVGRWILPGHDPKLIRLVDYVPQESLFWRRRVWERVGATFDANLQFAMDWDLILRFLDAGAEFRHVPSLFGVFRVHESQKSQVNFVERGVREMADLRLRHNDEKFGPIRRVLQHACYLYRHKQSDAAFQLGLRTQSLGLE